MSLAGRWMRRVRLDSCVDRSTAISTRVRLFRLFLLIPCWESQRLIPKSEPGRSKSQRQSVLLNGLGAAIFQRVARGRPRQHRAALGDLRKYDEPGVGSLVASPRIADRRPFLATRPGFRSHYEIRLTAFYLSPKRCRHRRHRPRRRSPGDCMLSSLALRSFIFHPNQWLVLKATRQAAKGFPDEDAAWIDGLAQRLDVANQLARRVAATTDPELRWRRSTTSAGFSWIPAYGQKIDS